MPKKKPRLLVVDDNEHIRSAMSRLFRRDFEVETAPSAEAALEVLASDTEWDVIVSDLHMYAMSGNDLFKVVQECYPRLVDRFIFSTGEPEDAIGPVVFDKMDHLGLVAEVTYRRTACRSTSSVPPD